MDKNAEFIAEKIMSIYREKGKATVAVDGRCASGKTTLAARLGELLDCGVFHTDDFFLRPVQRTEERLDECGGNMDRERLFEEVFKPLLSGKNFSYRPYNCRTGDFAEPVNVTAKAINIIEGAYSCHPMLWELYDLRIFLTVNSDEQIKRIKKRNGSDIDVFVKKWIPLEEKYFAGFDIAARCDFILKA